MTDAILEITDGTTTINLIQPLSGFHMTTWIPAITDYKGGGTFQNPPLANWRQLRDSKWDTAVENFGLTLNGTSPDTAAYQLQELRRLLEKANQYWTTDWQNTPVYVVAKMRCETNTRYCLVVKGRLGNDRNFYDQPVTGDVTTLQDLPLVIERRAWLATIPTVGTAINISAVEDYDGRSYGNVDSSGARVSTTADEVYIANKRNTANLTDIYNYDASGTSFSGNLLDAALPTTLFPSPAAVGDIIYFGIDTSLADSGPFVSLVLDIGTAASATSFTIIWEYFGPAGWTSLDTQDYTNTFQNTGVNSVHWNGPPAWTITTINGITGYWIRARITALTGAFTNPTQQNRDIYSIVWPYVEIQEDVIDGDISAPIELKLTIVSDKDGPLGNEPNLWSNFIIAGTRSLSRGGEFSAYLNCADEQNNSDVTVSLGTSVVFGNNSNSPTGRVATWTTGSATIEDRVLFTINKPLAQEYFGIYHAFVYAIISGVSVDDAQFRIRIKTGTAGESFSLTATVPSVVGAVVSLIDLGEISISPPIQGGNIDKLEIAIQAGGTTSTTTIDFYELILVPTDESVFQSIDSEKDLDNSTIENGRYLEITGLQPKQNAISVVREVADDDILGKYTTISPGQPVLQQGAQQRIWFLSAQSLESSGIITNTPSIGISYKVQLSVQQRYLSLRGNR